MAAEDIAVAKKELKRLGWVPGYVAGAVAATDKAYKVARAYVPTSVVPTLTKVEEAVSAYSAPALATAQDTGDKLLYAADEKLDYVLSGTGTALNSGTNYGLKSVKELHDSNLKAFQQATDNYFEFVAKTTDWAADKLNPAKNVQLAREGVHNVIAKAKEYSDPDVAVKAVYEAWEQFASIPAVSKVLTTAEPVTHRGLGSFYALHDYVVGSPYYKRAVDTGASTASWYTTTTPYKLSGKYLYPIVQPVADPTLETLSKSQVVTSLLTYWSPAAAA